MWRKIAGSVTGPSHARNGSPCQDHHTVHLLGESHPTSIVCCVADGAGSASQSAEGAALACEVISEGACQFFESAETFHTVSEDEALAWCRAARERIGEEATRTGHPLREYATTLCVALVSPGGAAFFQIGDGAIVARREGPWGVLFWPQSGEYANTTSFLTGDRFDEQLQFHSATGSFVDIALFTDGLERLALSFSGQTPHAPFFEPLFNVLRKNDQTDSLEKELRRFLESDSIKARSDDDKTVILATKIDA